MAVHVRTRSRLAWHGLAAAVAVPLAEAGHVLAYTARYGSRGLPMQSTGVHTYFPELLRFSVGAVAMTLLLGLLVVGLGRLLLGRGLGLRQAGGQGIGSLFLVAGAVQLNCYLVQETVETLVAREPYAFSTLLSILSWGMLGQLPLAALLACALGWLSVRLEAVAARIWRGVERSATSIPGPAPLVVSMPRRPQPHAAHVLSMVARQALLKRGPPPVSASR